MLLPIAPALDVPSDTPQRWPEPVAIRVRRIVVCAVLAAELIAVDQTLAPDSWHYVTRALLAWSAGNAIAGVLGPLGALTRLPWLVAPDDPWPRPSLRNAVNNVFLIIAVEAFIVASWLMHREPNLWWLTAWIALTCLALWKVVPYVVGLLERRAARANATGVSW
jgi:hypothetical protein